MHAQIAAKKDLQHFRAVFWQAEKGVLYSVLLPQPWFNKPPSRHTLSGEVISRTDIRPPPLKY